MDFSIGLDVEDAISNTDDVSPVTAATSQAGLQAPQSQHIVHLIASIDPATGGPASVSIRLAAAQAALGHSVTVISCLAPQRRAVFADAIAKVSGVQDVQLLLCPWTSDIRRWFGLRLTPILHSILPYTDVLHLHGVWEMMLVVAAHHARRYGVPYVVRPCGMLDPWSLRQRHLKKHLALSLTHRRFLQRAAFLHMLNADEARLIEPLRLRPPRRIIPNGVALEEVDDAADEARFAATFPQLAGRRYILFVGRLHYKKGLDLLAEAFARLAPRYPDVHLLVVGPDRGARSGFLEMVAARGLADRVHVPGPLYDGIKFAAYRHAACLCLPSRQEGFSVTVLEALCSRLPVAISDDTHFPEVARAGAGEVFALDVPAIVNSLHHMLAGGPADRQRMGEAGRRLVEAEYTWQRIAQLTTQAYAAARPTHRAAQAARA